MLEVDVHKSIGRFTLDLRFEHGEGILILFGRSGAGKTTALRMIAGIEKPTRGTIRFGGRTLFSGGGRHARATLGHGTRRGGHPLHRRINVPIQDRSIGYVFQHHNLFPHLTAYDNIAYAATDKSEIDRWVEVFGVQGVIDQYPSRLSGGEQQRVAILRALVAHPRMLLMDEPLSAVDIATRAGLWDELRRLQRSSGIPIIYVTHNVSEAYRLGDRVLVLESGKVIHDGVPIEVFHTPTSVPLASLSGTENLVDGVVEAHHLEDNTTDLRVGKVVLHVPLCRAQVGERAVVAIRPEDVLVARQWTPGTSARNQLRGFISKVQWDALPSIFVAVEDGPTIRAHVTRRSLAALGLTEGVEVHLLIKAWACHPIEGDGSG